MQQYDIAIVGGGPAGLMAAEVLAGAGARVAVFDAMPSVGRKFLMAGKGGMNITHSEPLAAFRARYGARAGEIAPLLDAFGPESLREWIHGLGIETFVGSSGRVFPRDMKAAPLLRAWLTRLRASGVSIHVRHRWIGWGQEGTPPTLRFATPEGSTEIRADAVVLAVGGASWPQLGSDAAWLPVLEARGVDIAPLQAANCGFDVGWSPFFAEHFAGEPIKSVSLECADAHGNTLRRTAEFMISATGVEGGGIYALSSPLREAIARDGEATLYVDLVPGRDAARVLADVSHPRGSRSMSSHLQSRLGLKGVKMALLRECAPPEVFSDAARLAACIKHLPLRLVAPRPIAEAISTAGGVRFEAIDANFMLRAVPGVFCAGEMLDWEAPTGGYLLTACFATGRSAAQGVLSWLLSLPDLPQRD
ncbi:TIGR03862 family flavoprotein [Uliginosibacterium sp. sgz301328]|uniref:TIGR03862 family flavoprotein n=1 Tax=Uliginosibacterium sp. sgz301328 TaxID=3243764 RepID=UPI00359D7390